MGRQRLQSPVQTIAVHPPEQDSRSRRASLVEESPGQTSQLQVPSFIGQGSRRQGSGEQVPGRQTAGGQVIGGQAAGGLVSGGVPAGRQVSEGQFGGRQVPGGKVSGGQVSREQVPPSQVRIGQLPSGKPQSRLSFQPSFNDSGIRKTSTSREYSKAPSTLNRWVFKI